MKLFIVAAIIGACVADRLDNKYLPPRGNAGAGFGPGFGLAPGAPKNNGLGGGFGGPSSFAPQGNYGAPQGGFGGGAQGGYAGAGADAGAQSYNARPQDAGAQILRLNSDVTAEGFSYDFETSNGIRADASGVATNGVQSQGSFAYKGDDGQDYSITYTADENGYQPQGAHLPTPPPIPEAILKSLEQNARDEAAGIVDDGTYRGEGAGAGVGGYSGGAGGAGGYSGGAGGAGGYSGGAGGAGGYSGGAGGAGGYSGGAGGAGGYSGGAGGFSGAGAATGGYGAKSGASAFGGSGSGARPFGGANNFGAAAASRQYLAPNRGSGNGNFNAQSGYRY